MSKIGKLMFNIISPPALFVSRHKVLFYILSYTWGLIGTLVGWCMFLFVRIFLHKKIIDKGKYYTARYILFGKYWGGLECGINILVADKMGAEYTIHTFQHELGHTYQNAVMGPFVILFFIISVTRYWILRLFKLDKDYDAFWYEASATYIGEQVTLHGKSKTV